MDPTSWASASQFNSPAAPVIVKEEQALLVPSVLVPMASAPLPGLDALLTACKSPDSLQIPAGRSVTLLLHCPRIDHTVSRCNHYGNILVLAFASVLEAGKDLIGTISTHLGLLWLDGLHLPGQAFLFVVTRVSLISLRFQVWVTLWLCAGDGLKPPWPAGP